MITIVTYLFVIILTLFICGYWITNILVDKAHLESHSFWLIPWFGICVLIFTLTIFSSIGISVKILSPIVLGIALILDIKQLKNNHIKINFLYDIFFCLIVAITLLFNIIIFYKYFPFPTTISLGNNDIIAYVASADYLYNSSILHGFFDNSISLGAETLISGSYRWGVILLTSFYKFIFRVNSYRYIYLIEVAVFSLIAPLLFKLLEKLYKKTFVGAITVSAFFAFNANMLYILFHNFYGQIIYIGLNILFLYLLSHYFIQANLKKQSDRYLTYTIGLVLVSIYFSYHEAIIFTLLPIVLLIIIQLLIKYKDFTKLLRKVMKIGLATFIMGSVSVFHNIFFDFYVRIAFDSHTTIGWPKFRESIPFANPYELLGLFSIHSSEPLPLYIAIFLSAVIMAVIILGILNTKQKYLLLSCITVCTYFLIHTSIISPNFFDYNRVATFTLPVVIVMFCVGLSVLNNFIYSKTRNRTIIIGIVLFICITEVYWGRQLLRRYENEVIAVDNSKISLESMNNIDISEPIYLHSSISDLYYWDSIWEEYFIFQINKYVKGSSSKYLQSYHHIPNEALFLMPTSIHRQNISKTLMKNVVWENEYYRIGRGCNSNECIMSTGYQLSEIRIGESMYEDSLLLNGWSNYENGGRWSNNKNSHLRLFTESSSNKILIEVLSFTVPQRVTIYVDGALIGDTKIDAKWGTYEFELLNQLEKGVHYVTIKSDNAYSPSTVLGNGDTRMLSFRLKYIGLK
jgi:hypothetical protein